MAIELTLIVIIVLLALYTCLARSVLKAAIGLAFTSALIAVLLFIYQAPLAGVFELSICAGLITVVFISTISLAEPLSESELKVRAKGRLKKYVPLPVILAAVAAVIWFSNIPADFITPAIPTNHDTRELLWNSRGMDMIGILLVLLTGVFGVVVLFKEEKEND